MSVLIVVALLAASLCVGGALLVVQTWRRSGRWGINFNSVRDIFNGAPLFGQVDCPSCGQKQQTVRKPASLPEILWGGWTCQNCGTKMDKWGKARSSP
jgi:hypothetical protein